MKERNRISNRAEDLTKDLQTSWLWKWKQAVNNREARLEKTKDAITGVQEWLKLYMLDLLSAVDIEWNINRIRRRLFGDGKEPPKRK